MHFDSNRHYKSDSYVAASSPNLFSHEGAAALKRAGKVIYTGITAGFVEAANAAWQDKSKTSTDLAFGIGSGVVLSIAERSSIARSGCAMLKAGLAVTFYRDIAENGLDVVDAALDSYRSATNIAADTDCMKKKLGQFAFDATLMTVASYGSEFLGKRAGFGLSHSSLDKIRANPLFNEMNILPDLEKRELAMKIGATNIAETRAYNRSLTYIDFRRRYQVEQSTFQLHHMFGFENEAPINLRTGNSNWAQEYMGGTLGAHLQSPSDDYTRSAQTESLKVGIEEALAERMLYGETDNHLSNIAIKKTAKVVPLKESLTNPDAQQKVANIDFDYCFGRMHPLWFRSGKVPQWGNTAPTVFNLVEREYAGKPLSQPLLEKIKAFKESYDHADLLSTGLTRTQAKALMKRVDWFVENKKFPQYKLHAWNH